MLGKLRLLATRRYDTARPHFGRGLIFILLCFALLAPTAMAQSWSWTGAGGDTLWSNANNWSPTGPPPAGAPVNITLSGTYTVDLDGDVNIGSLYLGTSSGPGVQTLAFNGHSMDTTSTSTVDGTGVLDIGSGSLTTSASKRGLPLTTLSNYGNIEMDNNANMTMDLDNGGNVAIRGTANFTGAVDNSSVGFIQILGGVLPGHMVVQNGTSAFNNNGTVSLEAESSNGDAQITVVNGTFINQASGTLRSEDSSALGGTRILDANLANTGSVEVGYAFRLVRANGSHVNDGAINVDAHMLVQQSGTPGIFVNNLSTGFIYVASASIFEVSGGTFNNQGSIEDPPSKRRGFMGQVIIDNGIFTGTATNTTLEYTLRDSDLVVGTINNSSILQIHGHCQVDDSSDITNTGQLIIDGNNAATGHLTFNYAGGNWTNSGTLDLTSSTTGDGAILEVQGGGIFFNTGVVNSLVGSSGDRTIDAPIDNQGIVNVDHDLVINPLAGDHYNGSTATINVNMGTLLIEQQAATNFVNDGTFNTFAGSTLLIRGGSLTTTGTLTKQKRRAGGLQIFENLNLNSSTITNTTDLVLINSVVAGDSTITNQGQVFVKGIVNYNGTLNNTATGTLNVEGSDPMSNGYGIGHLIFGAPFANDGTVTLFDAAPYDAILEVDSGGAFTNNAGATFESQANTGGGRVLNAQLVNNGLMEINESLLINPPFDVSHANNGTINVNVGSLDFAHNTNSSFTNAGVMAIDNAASFNVFDGSFFQFGTLSVTASPLNGKLPPAPQISLHSLTLDGSLTNDENMIITNVLVGSTGTIVNNGQLFATGSNTIDGGLVNNSSGNIDIQANGNDGPATLTYNISSSNAGTITLIDDDGQNSTLDGPGTLNNTGTLRTLLGLGGGRTISLPLINDGLFEVQHFTGLELTGVDSSNGMTGTIDMVAGQLDITIGAGQTFTNSGNINMGGGTSIDVLGPGTFDASTGTIGGIVVSRGTGGPPPVSLENVTVQGTYGNTLALVLRDVVFAAGSTLDNQGEVIALRTNTINGAINNQGTGVLLVTGDSVDGASTFNAPGFDNFGLVELGSNDVGLAATLNCSSPLQNRTSGTIASNGVPGGPDHTLNAQLHNEGAFDIFHPLVLGSTNLDHTNTGNINVVSTTNLTVADADPAAPQAQLINEGGLAIDTGASVVLQDAALFNGFPNPLRGFIGGDGTVDASNGTFTSEGDLGPGFSPGSLDVTGDLTMLPDNISFIEINGYTPATDFDQINATGTLNIAGTLDINLGSFTPLEGDIFTIMTAGNVSGTFGTIIGDEVGNGLILDVVYTTSTVELHAIPGGVHWANTGGGNWNDPANWNPAQVPGPCSMVSIDLDGTYTIEVDTNVDVWSIQLGAASGIQTLNTNGFGIEVQDFSQVGIHGVLNMDTSGFNPSATSCLESPKPRGLPGLPSLTIDGELNIYDIGNIGVSFGVGTGGVVNVIGTSGADALLLSHFGMVNDGTINLTDDGSGGGAAGIDLVGGVLINNGLIHSFAGDGGARSIRAPLDNNGTLQLDTPTQVDPVQVLSADRVKAYLEPDAETLALYHFDEESGAQIADASSFARDLAPEGTETVAGLFKGARIFDGQDDYLPMETLIADLDQRDYWSVSWFSRVYEDARPLLMLREMFSIDHRLDTDDRWHHYALVWDGSSLNAYRDGELSQANPIDNADTVSELTARLTLGRDGDSFYPGIADELRIRASVPDEAGFAQMADLATLANDSDTTSRINNPEGIRQLWLDACPVSVLGEDGQTIQLHSRAITAQMASKVHFVTHDGTTGRVERGVLVEDTSQPHTWLLTGSRANNKRATPDFNNYGVTNLANDAVLNLPGGVMYNLGTLSGTGLIDVTNAAFDSSGTISPGTSPGGLEVAGDATLGSTSTIDIELGGTTAITQYDKFTVSGNLTLDGIVNVTLINSFEPVGGELFEIVNFGTSSGAFAAVNQPPNPPDVNITHALLANGLVIEALPVFHFDFNPLTYTVREDDLGIADLVAVITVERVGNSNGFGSVIATTVDVGSATEGVDYDPVTQTLEFPPGTDVATFEVTVIDDRLVEGDESLELHLNSPVGGTLGNDVATLTIEDVEEGELAFDSATYTVAENEGSVDITVVRSNGTDGEVSVNFGNDDGSAQAGQDYTPNAQILSWADGESGPQTVTVTILDDQLVEGPENFFASLSLPTGNAVIGSPNPTEITITDYEEGAPTFTSAAYEVQEDGETAAITLERVGGTDGLLIVQVVSSDGTATAGVDYESVNELVTFADGDPGPITVSVPIIDDNLFEGDETVNLDFAKPEQLGGTIESAVLTILEDDEPPGVLEFAALDYVFSEAAGTALVQVIRLNGTGGEVTVDFETYDNGGGATAGEDYEAVAVTLTFPDGVQTQPVSIPIIKDTEPEPMEAFGMRLLNPTGGAELGELIDAPVTIVDNDDPPGTIQLVSETATVNENDGSVDIQVERVAGTGGQVSVAFTTVPTGSATPLVDYTPEQTILTWENGEGGTKIVTIGIIDNTEPEPDETFGVALSTPTGGATLGTASGVVTILDDDPNAPGAFALEQGTFFARESERFLTFQVLRTGGSGGEVSVDISALSGTAVSGDDFEPLNETVVFGDFDDTPKTVMLEIIDDAIAEGPEEFALQLSNPTGGASLGTPSTADVLLRDNEELSVSWASAGTTRGESNSTHTVTALLASIAGNEVTVGVEILARPNSADEGDEFTLSTQTLTFPSGTNTANLTLTIFDDDVLEGDEVIVLRLDSSEVDTGSIDTYEFVIADNDSAELTWNSVPVSLQEGIAAKADTTFTLVAELSAPIQRGGTFIFEADTASTATEGEDYRAPIRQLIFAPMATTAEATLTLVDDVLAENQETLILNLVGKGDVTSSDSVTIPIEDDDRARARVQWVGRGTPINEDDTAKRSVNVSVQAELNVVFDEPVTVDFNVSGLATFGEDHNLEPGSLTFESGDTSAWLSFDVIGDLTFEPNENIDIILTGGDVPVGSRDTFTVTVRDNDLGQVPDTEIEVISPEQNTTILQVKLGNPINLLGKVIDPDTTLTYSYLWEICLPNGCPQFTGDTLDYTFNTIGTYRVTCFATDSNGNADPTPAQLLVQVRENIPPVATITQPSGRDQVIPVGTTLDFTGQAEDAFKRTVVERRWFVNGDSESEVIDSDTYSFTFDEAGTFTVVYEVKDEDGAEASDFRNITVYEEAPPTSITITSPADGTTIEVGGDLHCSGELATAPSKLANYRWQWDLGNGKFLEGQEATWAPSMSGNYQIRLFVYDEDDNRVAEDVVNINVEDPSGIPEVTFGFPTGLRLEPGSSGKRADSCVYLNGIVLDSKGYKDLSFVYDVAGGRFNHETPGLVCFDEPGEYTVSMYAVTPTGQQSDVVTRTIIVRASSDEEFEPNDSFFTAPITRPGNYSNLTLDDDDAEDYFRVTVEEDGQRMIVKANVVGEALLEVFDEAGIAVGDPRPISGADNINLTGLAAGDYLIRISQADVSKRRGLDFSLSIGVLNPVLYFPDIRSDANFDTSIGVVNPTNELVCFEAVGFAVDGTILAEVPLELDPLARRHFNVSEIFGNLAGDVAWVQVDAIGELLGYARTESQDRREVYAVTANRELRSELHVPHIAERTEQWFTRAAVVNGGANSVSAKVETPTASRDLDLVSGFTQDAFNFVDRFDGSLPQGSAWANFRDQASDASLAGVEVFGTKDGSRVTAGLELADVRRDNPNFTFVQNNLYFTHIARNDDFYTGIALVNLGSLEQGVIIHAYRPDGSEVGDGMLRLMQPNEKLVTTASALLADMGTTKSEVDWLLVEADADITGFELFGTISGKQLAGLEASRALSENICYPFLDTNSNVAHGVSVVNVNSVPITVTFTLYDNNGNVLGTRDEDLNANQKFIGILSQMFPDIGDGIPGWLDATSSLTGGPVAGFELFINTSNGEQMGAVIAQ